MSIPFLGEYIRLLLPSLYNLETRVVYLRPIYVFLPTLLASISS